MSASTSAPIIFAPVRRLAARHRARRLQVRPDAARYLLDDMVEDVLDRVSFLRHPVSRALVVGDWSGMLAAALAAQGAEIVSADPAPVPGETELEEEQPYPLGGFDLIVSLGTLDTVNDLPGALIHIRRALAPGGLAIAEFVGAGSLPALRAAMAAADGDRPAPRLHPLVDVRGGGQLLQRAGWADPVIDSRTLRVSFGSLDRLIGDLRTQGLSSVLARSGPPLGKVALDRARQAFAAQADSDGRITETFEILTLSGWLPSTSSG